ncbi:MAG: glycine cleavage system protein GcvH [Deltaproteobacteria bacterium]|nr:glycine cleavage system protein GcvH [Deltaproteobacteria bacterium]
MGLPAELKYTSEHEWMRVDAGKVVVGITDYAQQELGDVVFVELPEVGTKVTKGQSFGTVESVKAVSDIYSPVDGKVVEVNAAVVDKPELINTAAFSEGWMIVIEPVDIGQIEGHMGADEYKAYLDEVSK